MPQISDFLLAPGSDGTVQVTMVPITPIGGWNIQFEVAKRFGGLSGLLTLYTNSGYNGVSGITIVNSGLGIFACKISGGALSGQDTIPYAFTVKRLGSGVQTLISEGYYILSY